MICNECHHVFAYKDAGVIHKKLYGLSIPEKRCPKCGGTFRAIELPNELDKYLYVNHDERYYVH
jgi:DNA polymerase III alpha subunit (gram-positive type)